MARANLTALVLSGGGARGAYEAGVMSFVLGEILAAKGAPERFDIYCGSSVGAINTCYLASVAHAEPAKAADILYKTWHDLRQDEIYVRDASAFASFLFHSVKGISLNFFRSPVRRPGKPEQHFNGFFDTRPLPRFIQGRVSFKDLNANVARGTIKAVSLTATNMHTDGLELFLKRHPSLAYTGHYHVRETPLATEHAMASGAIPIVFPPVRVGGRHYMDGGMRLNTPLSPAIHLGADKIFVVGLHNQDERRHVESSEGDFYYVPTLGDTIGKVLNSIFLDRIEYDLEQLGRINRIAEWGKLRYGADFVAEINRMLVKKGITGDIASRGLKELKVFSLFPSRDLRAVFGDCLNDPETYREHFGAFEKLLLRVLDVDLIQGRDFLSYLMFLPNYLARLLELGYADAKAQADAIREFFAA